MKNAHVSKLWDAHHSSYWFIPSIMEALYSLMHKGYRALVTPSAILYQKFYFKIGFLYSNFPLLLSKLYLSPIIVYLRNSKHLKNCKMEPTLRKHAKDTIQLNSLAELDQIVSEKFNLPIRPYSTDIRAALELVLHALEKTAFPYFQISHSKPNAFPGLRYAVSFDKEKRTYGKTAPLAICHDALHRLRGVVVTIPSCYYWDIE